MATQPQSLRSSERVEPEEFSRRVSSKLPGLRDVEIRFGKIYASTDATQIVDAVRTLKEDSDLACEFLTFLSGVDWQEEGFDVVITLFSLKYLNTVVLKVRLPAENPRMPTITGLFGGANWHEREAAEMFGIDFDGHPNLTNLYLPDDFEGHPLLKSFKLASRTYKLWPGAKDPGEAETGGR